MRRHSPISFYISSFLGQGVIIGEVFVRLIFVFSIILVTFIKCFVQYLLNLLPRLTTSRDARVGKHIYTALEKLKGLFPKIGQIASTRTDIFDEDICFWLRKLRTSCRPDDEYVVSLFFANEYSKSGATDRYVLSPHPIGCGSVAQVHSIQISDYPERLALKIIKPSVHGIWKTDLLIVNAVSKLLNPIAGRFGIATAESMSDIIEAIELHTSIFSEANNLQTVTDFFSHDASLRFPKLYTEAIADNFLIMELIENLRPIDDEILPVENARSAAKKILEFLFRLIFDLGIVHCDLHPGNVFLDDNGRLVILDFGGCKTLLPSVRIDFRLFFTCIITQDARTACRILVKNSVRLNKESIIDFELFERMVAQLLHDTAVMKVGEFRVMRFLKQLFWVHRKAGLIASSEFSSIILSLLVVEGVTIKVFPELNFQKLAYNVLTTPLCK